MTSTTAILLRTLSVVGKSDDNSLIEPRDDDNPPPAEVREV
jgi:hypothetical protein